MEIKFSSKIHVGRIDTMKVEHPQSGCVSCCPNNKLRYAAATLASLIVQLINPKYQNIPINFVEIKFSSRIHVGRIDTMKVEHPQSGCVSCCPNNKLRYAAATLASLIVQLINPKYQNIPINFVEIKFSSKIYVGRIDTMKVEHPQSGCVSCCPNNKLRYATATPII